MREPYSPLPDEGAVFRTVSIGGAFLPPDHELPLPAWLDPTSEDERAADAAGRPTGLSVWDHGLTTFRQACTWRAVDPSRERGFAARIAGMKSVGAEHGRRVDVVADRLDIEAPRYAAVLPALPASERPSLRRSAGGHSLVEGIKRPPATQKAAHRAFRDKLVREFRML